MLDIGRRGMTLCAGSPDLFFTCCKGLLQHDITHNFSCSICYIFNTFATAVAAGGKPRGGFARAFPGNAEASLGLNAGNLERPATIMVHAECTLTEPDV